MTTFLQSENFSSAYSEEKISYHDQLGRLLDPFLAQVDKVVFRYTLFHFFFMFLIMSEVLSLLFIFSITIHSLAFAFGLALIFFTFFTYFTLRIYLLTKKPEQLKAIKEQYTTDCRDLLLVQYGNQKEEEVHAALANACYKFANRLHAKEYQYYSSSLWPSFLVPWVERFSCWLYWEEIHFLKEILLQQAVEEHIKLVKAHPISLQAHANLANAYVMLSGLYIDPRKMEGYDDEHWIPPNKFDERQHTKFKATAEHAIEEFKILEEFAPDDPWVHSQLAYSYHDMQMPKEEILEYETIRRLLPTDKENLYKLGTLYFQQGMNAKGLKIYEELKRYHYTKLDQLIKHYGSQRGNHLT